MIEAMSLKLTRMITVDSDTMVKTIKFFFIDLKKFINTPTKNMPRIEFLKDNLRIFQKNKIKGYVKT
jgi:hypothetical protein